MQTSFISEFIKKNYKITMVKNGIGSIYNVTQQCIVDTIAILKEITGREHLKVLLKKLYQD